MPEEEINMFLSDYMKKLENAGFDESFRRDVSRSGRNGFNKQKEAAASGGKPLYRPKSWFKRGGYEDFIMIPATPGSELKKMIDERLKALGLWDKMRVIEKPGMKFIEVLKIQNKKKPKTLSEDKDCLVGQNPKGGNCWTNEIVYKITCKTCGDIYILGESSKNTHTHSKQHMELELELVVTVTA